MTCGEEGAWAEALERAQALLTERCLGEAIAAYEQAQQMGADADACAGGRWQAYMLMGDMEAAWKESDAIRERGRLDAHRFWDGSSLRAKTVMVRCLHGLGDTIQMLRYLPDLLDIAARVMLEIPPRLVPLMESLSLARDRRLEITTWDDHAVTGAARWDTQIEVTELPYIFRTRRDDLPMSVGYLRVADEEARRVQQGMGVADAIRVGLVWTAGEWNQERALAPSRLRPLVTRSAEFWSLVHRWQGAGSDEMGGKLKDAEMFGEGMLPMAAVVANLDLVITTDTLAAHIAGATGVPVWVMLPYVADWRWMSDAERSPWYPSMRLFRQSAPGDWDGVVARVDEALQGVLAQAGL